ncbi:MAG TPA: hypothetical protein ENG87_00585 [Candidatus Pacearchaeota archaeon]|nr:hypothetical protein BMS3Abin17_00967 [archaeon BMS3Abin17]HDK41845.1 hypothetical protein [Candidatus Pacearchaeota archaeon]HDZ60342.1 hypothetical protein [Candidatus Pacearchaeota archaeon]
MKKSKKRGSKKKVNERNNKILYIAIGIFVLIASIFLYSYFKPSDKGEVTFDNLAICLKANNVKMYGAEWCGYCKKQKALFGDSFQYIDYVDCDKNRETCSAERISGYPTWEIGGQKYSGVQSLRRLSELSGCELENAE